MRSSANSCIDENAIGALFDHRLTPAEADAIDRHVGHCEDCRNLLASMARLYAPSAPSRAIVQTTFPLDGLSRGASGDEASIRRLLALVGCERRVGQVLGGKWRLDAVLGVGGMAEVFAATHLTNGRRAAIKLLRREWMARPNVVFRFLREGYVANRISHPGAVAILDDGTADDGTPFLVLELLDGHTIGAHIRDPLPTRTVLWIAGEILDVLAAAHEQGIVHRDIKPENVLLTRGGAIKVLDFGIARMQELAPGARTGRATQDGMLIGTPAYMPPEQARGALDGIDARTDLWAVGATMFALLAGRAVHLGRTPNETLVSAMKPAPRLGTVASEIDPEIGAIVDRALAFSQHDRWPDARTMQSALRDLLARTGDAQARTPSRPPVDPWALTAPVAPEAAEAEPRRRRGGSFVLFAGLSLLAASALLVRSGGVRLGALAPSAPSPPAAAPSAEPSALPARPEPVVSASAVAIAPSDAPPAHAEAPSARPKLTRRPLIHRDRAELPPAPARSSAPPERTAPPPVDPPPPAPREDAHPLDRRD